MFTNKNEAALIQKLTDRFEPFFNVFILPLLLIVGIYFLHGINDDTIDDSLRIAFMKGLISKAPIHQWYAYLIFLSEIYVWLYKKMPGFPWYGASFLFFSYLAVVNCFFLIREVLKSQYVKKIFISLFLILFFYLFWAESFLLFTMTKVAMLTMLSLLGSAVILKWKGWTPAVIVVLSLNFVVFLFGLLARYEMAWIALPVLLILLALFPGKKNFGVQILGAAVMACVGLFLYLHLNPSEDQQYFNKAEPYIFTLQDSNAGASLADQESLKDSIKFVAVKNWLFNDRQEFDLEFLSHASNTSFLNLKFLQNWEDTSFRIRLLFDDLFHRSLPVVYFMGTLLIINLFFLIATADKIPALYFLLYHILFWSFVITVTIAVKMEFRVFDPLLVIYTTGSLMLFLLLFRKKNLKWAIGLLAIAGLLLLPHEYRYNHDLAAYEAKEFKLVQDTWNEIDNKFKGKFLVPDISAILQLSLSTPLCENKLSRYNKIISFDAGYSTFHSSFRNEMHELFGDENYGALYKFLLSQKNKVIFISTPERIQLMQAYLKVVYGQNYCFKIIEHGNLLEQLKNYGLRKQFHYYVFDDEGNCKVNERQVFLNKKLI